MSSTTGRRAVHAGLVMMVLAAVAIAGSIVVWLTFGGPSAAGAVVFEMPGTVTADLTRGEWGLYSREVDGRQRVAFGDQVAIHGPGQVATVETFGRHSDATTIAVDGKTYHAFLRLDVPTAGRYRLTVAHGAAGTRTPIVVGRYETDGGLARLVVLGVLAGAVLGAVGLVTAVTGQALGGHGRRPVPA